MGYSEADITAKGYDKWGFEVLWPNLVYFQYHGRVMPLNRDTAGVLVDEAVAGWAALNGKNPHEI